ncbi:MAG: hrpA, partial [Proteobacteria bacterium]|nr:hrpA [Pseudomonadota bacterium]
MTDELARRAPFFQHNRKLILDIEALEHRSRRPDVLVDEDLIHDFYDSLLPQEVVDVRGFEHWRREAERANP